MTAEAERLLRRYCAEGGGEEGATLVETALALTLIMLPVLFGVVMSSLAMYTYLYVADAAREGTRYAIVRGSQSCTISSTFPNCNMSVGSVTSSTDATKNPVLAEIETLQYPGLSETNLSAEVTWWYATTSNPTAGAYSQTTWTTQCTSDTAVTNDPCNKIGNAVQVVVKYTVPFIIPFWRSTNLTVQSQSKMMISE